MHSLSVTFYVHLYPYTFNFYMRSDGATRIIFKSLCKKLPENISFTPEKMPYSLVDLLNSSASRFVKHNCF